MSNRTKIKKRLLKPEKTLPPTSSKAPWRPPQALLAAVIFLALGTAILAKSLYLIVPAGIVLITLLVWSGLTARRSGMGSKGIRLTLMPAILIAVLLIIRVYTVLNK